MRGLATIDRQPVHPKTGESDAAKAAAGDRRAFERLYHGHVNRVYSLCARMVADRGHAEELTQDVFVRAWEKLHLFKGESSFATWLHRLAINVVLNDRAAVARRNARFDTPTGEGGGLEDIAGTVGSRLAPGELLDLEAAIAKLPPGARQVFVLHDVEGYKHEEIAVQFGVTTGSTKAQLHRARLLLRAALNR